MRATIKDVAKLAGVSTATVSNVLTSKKYVSPQLEEKIRKVMEELNYKPNITARGLKVNRTFTIGVIVPDIMNPFFAEIVKNIEEISNQEQYQIILCNSDENPDKEKTLLNTLLDNGVDGIINVTSRMQNKDLAMKMRVPMVIVDRPPFKTKENIAFIYADNYSGSQAVADLFISKDYTKFICIAGPVEEAPVARKRLNGFRDKLFSRGFTDRDIDIYTCKFSFDDGYQMMNRILLDYSPSVRKAVFVCSDIMAWGAVEACKSKNIRIPEDIAIAGHDNIWFSEYIGNGLTTVENSTKELGHQAAQMLFQALGEKRVFAGESVMLKSSLIERKTT